MADINFTTSPSPSSRTISFYSYPYNYNVLADSLDRILWDGAKRLVSFYNVSDPEITFS